MSDAVIVRLNGGLGNQMFQYAFGRAQSIRKNLPLVLDATDPVTPGMARPLSLTAFRPAGSVVRASLAVRGPSARFRVAQVLAGPDCIRKFSIPYLKEQSFDFDPTALGNAGGYYDGYWQSWRYFEDVWEQLEPDFRHSETGPPLNPQTHSWSKRLGDEAYIGMHVRRGDYTSDLNREHHGLCGSAYYRTAVEQIQHLRGASKVVIVSDDPSWCRTEFADKEWTVFSSSRCGVFDDFEILRRCRHHVISNSSLGWWAAWLARTREQTAVAPYPWFGYRAEAPHIYPSEWMQLNRASGNSASEDDRAAKAARVSVVMPAVNRPQLLADAVNSALRQSHPPHEIVIVANGATPAVKEAVRALQDANPAIILAVETDRTSLAAARNAGILKATGDWCAFLDDDDLWLPMKIEKQLAAAVRVNSPAVSCDFSIMTEEGALLTAGLTPRPTGMTWGQALTLGNYFSGGSAAIVRKDALVGAGLFDAGLVACEDHDMWRRLARTYFLYVVPEKLVIYRRHSAQMSRDPKIMLAGELAHLAKRIHQSTADDLPHVLAALRALPSLVARYMSEDDAARSVRRSDGRRMKAMRRIFSLLPAPCQIVLRRLLTRII